LPALFGLLRIEAAAIFLTPNPILTIITPLFFGLASLLI